MKIVLSLLALLSCATMWGKVGDTFVAKSIEGVDITFSVISEAENTCKVAGFDHQDQEGVLTVPESVHGYTVTAIGSWALYGSKKSAFYLPNTIKTIEEYAFFQNYYLKTIDIPGSVETIGKYAFEHCKILTNCIFHEGLKRIENEAFRFCELTSIELPLSLEYIGSKSFSNMPQLASVTVHSSTPIPYGKSNIFSDATYMRTTLYVPQGMSESFKTDKEWGKFRLVKEGEPLHECPADIAYPEDFGRQFIVLGDSATANINFVNQRINPVYTVSFIPIIDGVEGEEQTYVFPQPIAANGKPFTLPFTLPVYDEPKEVDVIFDIISMNGEPVDYGADIRPNSGGTACVFIPMLNHKVLIEDNTSTQCIWALRSDVGLEKVKEKYGDKIIRASKHLDNTMWSHPFSYIPLTPTCELDGDTGWRDETGDFHHYDPYYGEGSEPLGILDLVEKKMATPHFGNVKILSAQWDNAEQTDITIITESTINMSHYAEEERLFQIIYILVEDELKGEGPEWEQLNGYAGMTVDDPNLQPLTDLPYTITDMVYHDVAIGYYYKKFNQSFIYGEPQQQTYTLQLSELTQSLCQDKNKLSIVACIEDKSTKSRWVIGDFIDSDISSIASYSSGIQSIMEDAAPNDVYDLSGRKVKSATSTLDGLPNGVYIYGGKKIVIGSK